VAGLRVAGETAWQTTGGKPPESFSSEGRTALTQLRISQGAHRGSGLVLVLLVVR